MNNSVKRVLSLLLAVCFEAELLPVLAFAAASEDVFERYGKKSISTEEFYGYSDNYDVIAADVESRIPDKENMEINLCQGYENNSETTTALNKIVDAYIADHPEHFWVERYSGTIGTKEKIFKIKIKMNLELSSEEKRSSFALAADELFNSLDISSDMSEYEKAKIIHDKLIEVISLDEDAENASNAYGAIVQRSAGSRGYAKAYQYLLFRAGMQAGTVSGNILETGEIKYWNFVKIDGNYYYTDVSADDCGDTPAYTYFGINAESMSTERKIDLLSYGKLPKCDLNLEKPEIIEHEHVFDCEVEDEKYIVSCFCTKPSVYYKSCACGKKSEDETFVSKKILGHNLGEYQYNGDASCGKDGTETAICARCGENYTRNVENTALEHCFEYVYNGDATCTKNGTKTSVCSNCGEMNKSDTVEAEGTKLEHSFTNYAYNDDATCKNDGTETAFCDREGCSGSDTRAATGTRLEHDYVKTIKEPTCTEEGCVFNQCRGVNCVCNDWYKSETIAATGHSGGTASCAKKAVCKVCGMEYGDFAKHEYDTENFVPAGEAGHFYMCINCPAHTRAEPHVPGPEATELSPQVCLACGYIIKPALMHRHRPTKVPAKPSTCTEPGNIEYYICSCGHYFLDINCITEVVIISNLELAPKGHSFTKYKSDKNATCEKDGTETAKCDNCHETNTRTEENSQLPHQYKEEVIKPTCTEGGYTVFTCKNCGYSYTGDETECLGHSYEAVVIDPECTSCGYTIHTCIRCREEYRDSETPAIGHEWSEATCTEPEKCSRCGMEDGLPKGHELSEWQSNPGKHWKFCTREECGRKISETEGKHSDADYDGICDICGYHYPEIYSVIGGQNAVLENVSIQTFTFRANGDFEKFTNLKIDGRTVMRDFYTAYSGSTVICFASEYLKTLSLGKHKIEFIYTDGIAVSDFAIKSIGPPPKKINTAPVTSTIIITPAEAAPETSESEELNPQTGAPTP